MNFLFAIALAAAGTAVGLYCSVRLKKRKQTLEQAVLLLDEIQIKIGYQALPVCEILAGAAESGSYGRLEFLNELSGISDDGNFHRKWEDGIKNSDGFSDEDKAILLALGNGLGGSNINGQLSLLQTHRALLERQLAAADDEYGRKGRMVRSVGALCGLAAGIAVL